jgi:hypothetical protein
MLIRPYLADQAFEAGGICDMSLTFKKSVTPLPCEYRHGHAARRREGDRACAARVQTQSRFSRDALMQQPCRRALQRRQ